MRANEGPDQPAHVHSLIRASVLQLKESIDTWTGSITSETPDQDVCMRIFISLHRLLRSHTVNAKQIRRAHQIKVRCS